MRPFIVVVVLAIAALFVPSTAFALPPDSPTPSYSPDDIPPADDAWFATYPQNRDATFFQPRPNSLVSYIRTTPNEERVWFVPNGTAANAPPYNWVHAAVYYNRRYRADASQPWMWQWSRSPHIFSFPRPSSVMVLSVLYSPTPKYGDPAIGASSYNYLMYAVYQPDACNGPTAGILMASFSNDGANWIAPVAAHRAGGGSVTCIPNGTDIVNIESASVVDGGSLLYFIGMDGDNTQKGNPNNMNATAAWWGTIDPAAALTVFRPANYNVTASGVLTPKAPGMDYHDGCVCSYDRYRTYAYFFNVSMAYDAANGDLYVSRAYAYPYDRGSCAPLRECTAGIYEVPLAYQTGEILVWNPYLAADGYSGAYQTTSGAPLGLVVYPNRAQIYKMHIGALTAANFGLVASGSWSLVADWGNYTGYGWQYTNGYLPLAPGQSNVGHDYGMANFVRDAAGNLIDGGYVLASTDLRSTLSVGLPMVTGAERTFYVAIPH